MGTKKKNTEYPKVTVGSHCTIIEHENGNFEMTWDWDQLNKDINNAINARTSANKPEPNKKSKKKSSVGGRTNTKPNSKRKGEKNEMV